MASNRRSDLTSSFDDMLDQNQRQFDDLYTGSRPRQPAARPASPPSPPASPAPRRASDQTDAVRFLNDRYGERWHYEIADRRREGDEVIVLCKLVVADLDNAKSQFGRARIGQSGAAPAAKGSADGVAFALGPEPSSAAGIAGDPEDAAFRQAVDAALANCAALL